MTKPKIGFVGQGWIGKNYADNYEDRGYEIVRYALEEPYVQNKDKIKECDITLIAVPTPTTKKGFDLNVVRSALELIGKGKVAVIKSTITPGSTEILQKEFPDIFVLHSPEFLAESTAKEDVEKPSRNIVGIPRDTSAFQNVAIEVLRTFPKSKTEIICSSNESEAIKYIANCLLYSRVVMANIFYDWVEKLGGDWENIYKGVSSDPRIGTSHLRPVHASRPGVKSGRGAGGHCFIKDFAAMRMEYEKLFPEDELGLDLLHAFENKNNKLLRDSAKDLDLLEGVYGD